MVCPPATSEAEARWPRFGLVVVATTSRRDNKDQMIRPIVSYYSRCCRTTWPQDDFFTTILLYGRFLKSLGHLRFSVKTSLAQWDLLLCVSKKTLDNRAKVECSGKGLMVC
jgi:hypothetical protein